jgi:hypothetical protein
MGFYQQASDRRRLLGIPSFLRKGGRCAPAYGAATVKVTLPLTVGSALSMPVSV